MQPSSTRMIRIVVNGQPVDAPGNSTLVEILRFLAIDPARVAVELDRRIVHRRDWESAMIGDGACLEIVHFVGGG